MKELNERESMDIMGGAMPWWIPLSIGLGLLAVFGIGVWSGYTRPMKCH